MGSKTAATVYFSGLMKGSISNPVQRPAVVVGDLKHRCIGDMRCPSSALPPGRTQPFVHNDILRLDQRQD